MNDFGEADKLLILMAPINGNKKRIQPIRNTRTNKGREKRSGK